MASLFIKFRTFERSILGRILPDDIKDEIGRQLFSDLEHRNEELKILVDAHEMQQGLRSELLSAGNDDNWDIKAYEFNQIVYPKLIGLKEGGPPIYDYNTQKHTYKK